MMALGAKFLPAVVLAASAFALPAFAQTNGTAPTPPTPPAMSGNSATSPSYSDATMSKAGHALHDVLAINESYRQKLVATNDTNTKRQLASEAQQKATAAVTRDGLSVDQYNQILAQARQDPALRTRLLNAAGIPENGK